MKIIVNKSLKSHLPFCIAIHVFYRLWFLSNYSKGTKRINGVLSLLPPVTDLVKTSSIYLSQLRNLGRVNKGHNCFPHLWSPGRNNYFKNKRVP